jgi:hypothetical protein
VAGYDQWSLRGLKIYAGRDADENL